ELEREGRRGGGRRSRGGRGGPEQGIQRGGQAVRPADGGGPRQRQQGTDGAGREQRRDARRQGAEEQFDDGPPEQAAGRRIRPRIRQGDGQGPQEGRRGVPPHALRRGRSD